MGMLNFIPIKYKKLIVIINETKTKENFLILFIKIIAPTIIDDFITLVIILGLIEVILP
jgi:hypothetical protein